MTKTWTICGTLTFTNDWTGEERSFRIPPFTVADSTPWVDVVDTAEDRTVARHAELQRGTWFLMDDTGIEEREVN